MYLTKLLALALATVSTAAACKCHDLDTRDVEWNVSFKCCKQAVGFWIKKDCKSPAENFGDCCRYRGYAADCY